MTVYALVTEEDYLLEVFSTQEKATEVQKSEEPYLTKVDSRVVPFDVNPDNSDKLHVTLSEAWY
jgi:hypothetical protein